MRAPVPAPTAEPTSALFCCGVWQAETETAAASASERANILFMETISRDFQSIRVATCAATGAAPAGQPPAGAAQSHKEGKAAMNDVLDAAVTRWPRQPHSSRAGRQRSSDRHPSRRSGDDRNQLGCRFGFGIGEGQDALRRQRAGEHEQVLNRIPASVDLEASPRLRDLNEV